MLEKERGFICEGISYSIVKEKYPGYSLDNINILIKKEACLSSLEKLINNFLSDRDLAVLFNLAFFSSKHYRDNDFGTFKKYSREFMSGVILKSGMTGNSSLQLICAPEALVEYHRNEMRINVSTLNGGDLSYTFINGIIPLNIEDSNGNQSYEALSRLDNVMEAKSLSLDKLGRTWLYLDNILDWYDELNYTRSEFFKEKHLSKNFIPASTGIGLGNYSGSSIALSALSVSGEKAIIETVESPLQCAALDYKSSFSRALLIKSKNAHKLLVSGTASIAPGGETIFPESVHKQIEKTFEVIAALLDNNSMSFSCVSRAIAYFPEEGFINDFDSICLKYGLDCKHVLKVHGVVCRPDLLFEMELDAVLEVS